MSPTDPHRPPRFFYGWVIVAVVFVTLFYALGIRFAFGVFYVAILEETGWPRAQAASVFSLAMVSYAVTAVLSGTLLDRLGPRLLFPLGALVMGTGLILSGRITTLGELYLSYGVIVGVGYAFLGFIPHMALVTRWFVRRRGLATAIAASGIGVGSLGMSKLSEWLIGVVGWRDAFFWYGIAGMVLLIPLTWFLHRDQPAAIGLEPDGRSPLHGANSARAPTSVSLRTALRHPALWMLLIHVGTVGWTSFTLAVHQTQLTMDLGFPFAIAATFFGLSGLFRSVGGMIWGPLSDRVGRRLCVTAATAMGLVGIVLLMGIRDGSQIITLAAFVLAWGIGYNGITPLYASTVADRFHGRSLGAIFGFLDLGFGAGAAIGPWVTGYLFDLSGAYDLALWLMLWITLLGGALLYLAALPRSLRPTTAATP
jgi:MFS family permease